MKESNYQIETLPAEGSEQLSDLMAEARAEHSARGAKKS